MKLKEVLPQIYSLKNKRIGLGLKNTKRFFSFLHHPEDHPRIIHFAGTNGKGSTLYTLEQLLLQSGFQVGSTISPHLDKYNERFRIDGKDVEDSLLENTLNSILERLGANQNNLSDSSSWRIPVTFFELSIGLAFMIFKQFPLDYLLIETGLGGRLDATNAIKQSIASVITRIDYDHMEFLGDTLEEIAAEKFAICKPNSHIFIAPQRKEVFSWFYKQLRNKENIFSFVNQPPMEGNRASFFYDGETIEVEKKLIGLKGDHQIENISTALRVYEDLIESEKKLSSLQVIDVLKSLSWRGRLEYLDKEKKVLVDSAHNSSGLKAAFEFLSSSYKDQKIAFFLFSLKKKSLESLKLFSSLRVDFFIIKDEIEGEKNQFHLQEILEENSLKFKESLYLKELKHKFEKMKEDYDLLFFSGSIYFLGEFQRHFPKDFFQVRK